MRFKVLRDAVLSEHIKAIGADQLRDAMVDFGKGRTDVKLEGGATAVKNVARGDVKLYVDLADLTPGTYVLPVKVEAIDGISSSDITLTRASVTVTIEKR